MLALIKHWLPTVAFVVGMIAIAWLLGEAITVPV